MIFITTWKEDSDLEVSSTSIEEEYIVEHIVEPIVEPWTDSPRSTCEDNLISPEPISPALTGQATALRAKAFQKTASSPTKYYITQGETKRLGVTVSSGAKYLLVNLNWGDKTDTLTLSGKTPSAGNLKNYSDTSDGSADGKVLVKIYSTNGTYVEQGEWVFKVYGKKVRGTEDFTFAVKQC